MGDYIKNTATDIKDTNVLEAHFTSNLDGTYEGRVVAKSSDDSVVTIVFPAIKKEGLFINTAYVEDTKFVHPGNGAQFSYLGFSNYTMKVNVTARDFGKSSVVFSELIDYLTNKCRSLIKEVKQKEDERSKLFQESSKKNKKYKQVIKSLQQTIGKLIDINKDIA